MTDYLKLHGKYIGVDPAHPETVYANRTAGGAWEEVTPTSFGKQDVWHFTAANVVVSINDQGHLESRPPNYDGFPAERLDRFPTMFVGRADVPQTRLEVENTGAPPSGGGGQSGFLSVRGRGINDPNAGKPFTFGEIVDDQGRPWPLVAYTMHTLISSLAKGDDIGPRLDEAIGYGYNTIIEIACHLSDWKKANGFYYDPRRSDHPALLAALFDACAAKGLRVWHRALADAQGLSQAEQTAIWNTSCAIAHGRWNVINCIGNEFGANGYDWAAFSKPADTAGVLYTRGSVGDDAVIMSSSKQWDIVEMESRIDMVKAMTDATCIELSFGGWAENPNGIPKPIVDIEPPRFNDTPVDWTGDSDRWTDPFLAGMLGAMIGAGSCGGGFAASDGLVCRPLQPRAADCARAFAKGLRGAFAGRQV